MPQFARQNEPIIFSLNEPTHTNYCPTIIQVDQEMCQLCADTYLGVPHEHLVSRNPDLVQFEEAIVHTKVAQLGSNVSYSDTYSTSIGDVIIISYEVESQQYSASGAHNLIIKNKFSHF